MEYFTRTWISARKLKQGIANAKQEVDLLIYDDTPDITSYGLADCFNLFNTQSALKQWL